MKEYGNYLSREDVSIPNSTHYIGSVVEKVKNIGSITKQNAILKDVVRTLVHEAKERNEMRMFVENIAPGTYIFCAYFDYNGRIYYWWEMFKTDAYYLTQERIRKWDCDFGSGDGLDSLWSLNQLYKSEEFVKSALEVQIVGRADQLTYVWFSTDNRQTPLMCTERFKNRVVKF